MRGNGIRFMGLILVFLPISATAFAAAAPAEKIDLRVLYVGHPDSDREKDFVSFLERHFKKVETGDLQTFTGRNTTGSAIIILDYDGEVFKSPKPQLPRDYARATVTVGVAGALICDMQRLKTGYL